MSTPLIGVTSNFFDPPHFYYHYNLTIKSHIITTTTIKSPIVHTVVTIKSPIVHMVMRLLVVTIKSPIVIVQVVRVVRLLVVWVMRFLVVIPNLTTTRVVVKARFLTFVTMALIDGTFASREGVLARSCISREGYAKALSHLKRGVYKHTYHNQDS